MEECVYHILKNHVIWMPSVFYAFNLIILIIKEKRDLSLCHIILFRSAVITDIFSIGQLIWKTLYTSLHCFMFSLRGAFIVIFCLSATIINVAGFMHFWGLTIGEHMFLSFANRSVRYRRTNLSPTTRRHCL